MALETFHPFPRLPTELKLKIWELARTTTPRHIVLCHGGYQNCEVPAMLHACSLSRSIALKWYTLLDPGCKWLERPFYINSSIDIVVDRNFVRKHVGTALRDGASVGSNWLDRLQKAYPAEVHSPTAQEPSDFTASDLFYEFMDLWTFPNDGVMVEVRIVNSSWANS